MSNLFYHLTDSQWKKIEFFFPARRSKVRPPLNPIVVLNGILWILVGETCPLVLVIGIVFITSSDNGSGSVFLKKSYEL